LRPRSGSHGQNRRRVGDAEGNRTRRTGYPHLISFQYKHVPERPSKSRRWAPSSDRSITAIRADRHAPRAAGPPGPAARTAGPVTSVAGGVDDVFATTLAFMRVRPPPAPVPERAGQRPVREVGPDLPATPPRRRVSSPQNGGVSSLLVAAGLTCGRAVRAGWLMAAKGHRGARAVDRSRPRHRARHRPRRRRAGPAGRAVVVAASSWFDAARRSRMGG